jgi:glycosyltransferase involved in cell wall biosynthesis
VVEPALARTLDATTVADPATAEKFSGSARPVLVVHNFPWRELGDTEPAAEPRFDVTYHGSLPGYHVDHIVAVARLLRERGHDVSWCLAALSYGEADQRRLERRLEEAGVREQFTLMYNLTAAEIPALLADTRLGFIPLPDVEKFRRNLPMKLFEFMSLGRPAVISDLPPVRRIAGLDECALLVQPGDDEAYADALERLLIDPELAAGMGARGKRLIAERLNADVELRDYVALCTRLSSNGSRP